MKGAGFWLLKRGGKRRSKTAITFISTFTAISTPTVRRRTSAQTTRAMPSIPNIFKPLPISKTEKQRTRIATEIIKRIARAKATFSHTLRALPFTFARTRENAKLFFSLPTCKRTPERFRSHTVSCRGCRGLRVPRGRICLQDIYFRRG